MGNIKFEGDPPYTLPMAQTVTARPGRKTVEVILEVIAPGKVPSLVPIKIQMAPDSARTLQAQLQPAIRMTEAYQKQ